MEIFNSCIRHFTEDPDDCVDVISRAVADLRNLVLDDEDVTKLVNILYLEYTEATCFRQSWMSFWYSLYSPRSMLPRFQKAIFKKVGEGSQRLEVYLSSNLQCVRERAIHFINFLAGLLILINEDANHNDPEEEHWNEACTLLFTFLEDATFMLTFPTEVNIEAVLNALEEMDDMLDSFGGELLTMLSDLEDRLCLLVNEE